MCFVYQVFCLGAVIYLAGVLHVVPGDLYSNPLIDKGWINNNIND